MWLSWKYINYIFVLHLLNIFKAIKIFIESLKHSMYEHMSIMHILNVLQRQLLVKFTCNFEYYVKSQKICCSQEQGVSSSGKSKFSY